MSTQSTRSKTRKDRVALFIVVALIIITLACDLVRMLTRKIKHAVHSPRAEK